VSGVRASQISLHRALAIPGPPEVSDSVGNLTIETTEYGVDRLNTHCLILSRPEPIPRAQSGSVIATL